MLKRLPRKRSEWDITPIRDQVTDLAIADATSSEFVEPEEDFEIMNTGENEDLAPGALGDPSDKTLILEVLQDEFSSSFEEELDEFEDMLDTFDDSPEPLDEDWGGENSKDSPVDKFTPQEPWNDAWEIIARRMAYDISNFYEEGATSPKMGPVSLAIDIEISTEQWANEEGLEDLQDYVQTYVKKTLNLKDEHHILVTVETVPEASEEGLPIKVIVDLQGISPDKAYELDLLVQGLVFEAVQHFKG